MPVNKTKSYFMSTFVVSVIEIKYKATEITITMQARDPYNL